jgi:hypothetical protein
METTIRTCEPIAGTVTSVLLKSGSSAKCLWRAARERAFLITTGITSHRWLAGADPSVPTGWTWQRVLEYPAPLSASDYVEAAWPKGEKTVDVHVVTTQVRSLSRCQVVIVRQLLDAPVSQARDGASSDLEASPEMLLSHIAARWDIEVLFGESKEERGLDRYQFMSARASVRFWTLMRLASVFLADQPRGLPSQWQRHISLGEARREIQRRHRRHVRAWLPEKF